MNKLIDYLIIVSFLAIALKSAFPVVLNHGFIQSTSLLVFSLLAPIGFATNLQAYFALETKSSWQWFKPSNYLILFCLVLLGYQLRFYSSQSTFSDLDALDHSLSSNLLNGLGTAKSEEQRAMFAKYIYAELGTAVPYANKDGIVTIYEPDHETIKLYQKKVETQNYKALLKSIARENMYITIYLVSSFLVLFCGSMFFIQHKANKRFKNGRRKKRGAL